jgi:hypothetical protein
VVGWNLERGLGYRLVREGSLQVATVPVQLRLIERLPRPRFFLTWLGVDLEGGGPHEEERRVLKALAHSEGKDCDGVWGQAPEPSPDFQREGVMTDKKYRDAVTGEYVTKEYAEGHPDTTVGEAVGHGLTVENIEAMRLPACSECKTTLNSRNRVDIKEFANLCYDCYKLKPKHVCVDFDGVLAEYTGWKGPDHLGTPGPGAKHFLEQINSLGMLVIILTTREPGKVREWLLQNDMIHLVSRVTREKLPALAYIDDRAIIFRGSFSDALTDLKGFVPYWREG